MDIAQPDALEQARQLAGHARFLRAKQVPGPVKSLLPNGKQARQGRAGALANGLAFGNADHPASASDALVFDEEFEPIPGAQKAPAQALVDQVKRLGREFQRLERVHSHKLHAVLQAQGTCLSSRVLDHFAVHIDADQGLDGRIRLCGFDEPAAGTTAHIEHPAKARWIGLLWQHTAHVSGDELLLDRQTGKFFFLVAILDEVRIGQFGLPSAPVRGC